jgi:hypothetical protein
MDETERALTGAASARAVLKDAVTASVIMVCAFLAEFTKHALFMDEPPFILRSGVTLVEIILLLSFLVPFIRASRWVIESILFHGAMKTARALFAAICATAPLQIWPSLIIEIMTALKDAVYISLMAGFVTGCLAFLILAISWSPRWVRFAIFAVGLMINVVPFWLLSIEERMNRRSGIRVVSDGADLVDYVFVFVIGGSIWALLFGGVMESYISIIQMVGSALVGWQCSCGGKFSTFG